MTKKEYFFSGGICCYNGCDFEDVILCCKGSGECCCLAHQECCAMGVSPFEVGYVSPNVLNQEYFRVGGYCCTCAVKRPQNFCTLAGQVCCCVQAAALPFDKEYVGEPIVGLFCVQCLPEFGFAQPIPKCSGLDKVGGATPLSRFMLR
jgi:hypothetical protein